MKGTCLGSWLWGATGVHDCHETWAQFKPVLLFIEISMLVLSGRIWVITILLKWYTRCNQTSSLYALLPRWSCFICASVGSKPGLAQVCAVFRFSPSWLHVSHQQMSHAVTRQHFSHYKDSLQLLPHLEPQRATVYERNREKVHWQLRL